MRRIAAAALLVVSLLMSNLAYPAPARADDDGDGRVSGPKTATPIKHLVVIFDENNSFDHYFGTYPERHESSRRAGISWRSEHSGGQWTDADSAHE